MALPRICNAKRHILFHLPISMRLAVKAGGAIIETPMQEKRGVEIFIYFHGYGILPIEVCTRIVGIIFQASLPHHIFEHCGFEMRLYLGTEILGMLPSGVDTVSVGQLAIAHKFVIIR